MGRAGIFLKDIIGMNAAELFTPSKEVEFQDQPGTKIAIMQLFQRLQSKFGLAYWHPFLGGFLHAR